MLGDQIRHDVWSAALDELEANVEHITVWLTNLDSSSKDDVDGLDTLAMHAMTWSVPPDLPGQIPVVLVPRAQAIAMRQSAVRTEITEKMKSIRDQLSLARRVESATAPVATPAYLDLRA